MNYHLRLLSYYMFNPSLDNEIDYQDHLTRLAHYLEHVESLSSEEAEKEFKEVTSF